VHGFNNEMNIPRQSSACKRGRWFCWASVLQATRSWARTESCRTALVATTTTTTTV